MWHSWQRCNMLQHGATRQRLSGAMNSCASIAPEPSESIMSKSCCRSTWVKINEDQVKIVKHNEKYSKVILDIQMHAKNCKNPHLIYIHNSEPTLKLGISTSSSSTPKLLSLLRKARPMYFVRLPFTVCDVHESSPALHSLDYLQFTFLCEMAFKNFVEAICDSPTIHASQYIDRIEHIYIFERQNHVVLRAPSIRSWRVSSPLPDLSKRLKIFSKNFLQANQQNQNYRHAMSAIRTASTPQTANTLCLQPGAVFGKT